MLAVECLSNLFTLLRTDAILVFDGFQYLLVENLLKKLAQYRESETPSLGMQWLHDFYL